MEKKKGSKVVHISAVDALIASLLNCEERKENVYTRPGSGCL